MVFVFLLYLISPLNWEKDNLLLLTIFYISVLFAIYSGYNYGTKLTIKRNKRKIFLSSRSINLLLIMCVIDLYPFLMVALAEKQITLGIIMTKIYLASQDMGNAYYERGENILALSIFDNYWLFYHFIFYPICIFVVYNSLLCFKNLNLFQKILLSLVVILQIGSYIIVGTNKLIFDYLVIFLLIFVLKLYKKHHYTYLNLKLFSKQHILSIVFVVLAIIFFGKTFSSRISNKKDYFQTYNTINGKPINRSYINFLPLDIQGQILGFDSYLTQGLEHLDKALGMKFEWCQGLGSSPYLDIMLGFLGIDSSEEKQKTYEYRISKSEGVKNGQYWYSAYVAFANDISFAFVPLLIFFLAIMWGHYWNACLSTDDTSYFPIFVLLTICFFYLNANNQIFGKVQLGSFIPLYIISKLFDIRFACKNSYFKTN